ncbi:MAG: signal peptidase I [Dehalococcoidia bacterium]
MKSRRGLVASLSSAFTVVAVIAAWILFAPPQLGGQTSYVIVNGNSMEPGMHRGDLAIVRKTSDYEVGDVVTYRHPEIGPVIHRIIERDGSHYVFQGDHNDFIDSYHPTQQELIGKLWIHIPGVGSWLTRFHNPFFMVGLLFVAFVGFGGFTAKAKASRTGRHPNRANQPAPTTGGSPMNQLLRNWQDSVSILAATGIAFVVLGWIAFHRPTEHQVPADLPYTQSGTFGYSAVPADGRVYDTGLATSGEPVYRRLSDQVAFTFDYEFTSSAASSTNGSYQMVAELGDQNGWRRTIELTPKTNFTGAEFTASGVLNLGEVQSLISILEEQSGVKNDKYSVTIRPEVDVTGSVNGTPFTDSFEPSLPMSLDKVQLKMDARSDDKTPLTPGTDGLVSTLQTRSNMISLLAFSLPVSLARVLSIAVVGLVIAVTGWLLIAAVRLGKLSRTDVVGGRSFRSPLVNVRGGVPGQRVIDVASLDDLGRIAAKLGAVVLQEVRPGYHAFFVHDMEVTYRYEALAEDDEHSTNPVFPSRAA